MLGEPFLVDSGFLRRTYVPWLPSCAEQLDPNCRFHGGTEGPRRLFLVAAQLGIRGAVA